MCTSTTIVGGVGCQGRRYYVGSSRILSGLFSDVQWHAWCRRI